MHSFAGDDWKACRDYLKALGFIADGYEKRNHYSPPPSAATDDSQKKIEYALNIWQQCLPAAGSLVEIYLKHRNLSLIPDAPVRFHPVCPRGKERLPAMVSLMTDAVTNEPCGIHRIYLKDDGSGKVDSEPQKAMLGRATGAVVRLSSDDAVTTGLGIVEGIENGLAILGFGFAPVWSALSAGGISGFPVLPGIEALTIFADHDNAGLNAARACASRWAGAGNEVTIRKPLKAGSDWNDIASKVQNE
ncbi:MAG: toprim domain-containing protein [Proteobacteria bacterium]|nr:toprim domain-containing protein [Pseudomonadota bacterium]